MHRHDLNLIAEYADGSLTDVATARDLVEKCEVCAAEYELQRSVVDLLAEAGPATMSDHEKTALHRDLWTELRTGAGSTPASARFPLWQRVAFSGAAIVVLLVGVFAALNHFTGDSGTTAVFSEIGSGLSGGETFYDADDAGGGDGEESLAPAAEGLNRLSEKYAATPFALLAREVRRGTTSADQGASGPSEDLETCLGESGLVDHVLVPGFEQETDLLIAVPEDTDLTTAPVSFIAPETCTVVHVDG